MIKNFVPRLYQEAIFASASKKNSLIVLPTGLGKTNIFLMLAAHRLKLYPGSKVVLLGPTRPLIEQYYKVFAKHFDISEDKLAVFTGNVKPERRAELWKKAIIIFSTPQGFENDIISSRISVEDISLLGFDEAHRAVGDYSYVFIAKHYYEKARFPRIVALTASPGSDREKIDEVISNLFIENIELRDESSPDVRPFIQKVRKKVVSVDFPDEFKELKAYLEKCYKSKLEEIKGYGYVSDVKLFLESKKDILKLQAELQAELASGNRGFEVLKSLSLAAEALKVQHAIELIETQGLSQLLDYLEQIESSAYTSSVKAVQNLAKDINFRSALIKARTLSEKGLKHPKLAELVKQLNLLKLRKAKTGVSSSNGPDSVNASNSIKAIVFTQYRDSSLEIVEELRTAGYSAEIFVGQAKKRSTGLSQKQQIKLLKEFSEGRFDVLVATSVGEEGLDIPEVDVVIFYEPIPSAIRAIQRRGRTGRLRSGEVIILATKGTRDMGYRWSAYHKEKRMHRILESLKNSMAIKSKPYLSGLPSQKDSGYSKAYSTRSIAFEGQKSLNSFTGQSKTKSKTESTKHDEGAKETVIYVDHREKSSGVVKELFSIGVKLKLEKLESADYIVSSRCAIEFKTAEDFVDSLIDGRLLSQLKELKERFEKPVIIVEGITDIFSIRNVHPNALRGLLATIAVSYGIPILYTKNSFDTASMIYIIAKREQELTGKSFNMHSSKKLKSDSDKIVYVVSSFPGIGPGLAKPLLERLGTIRNIVNAREDELMAIDKIGKLKAKSLVELFNKKLEY